MYQEQRQQDSPRTSPQSRLRQPTINVKSYYTQAADLIEGLKKLNLLPETPGSRGLLYCVVPADKVELMKSDGTYLKKGGKPANAIFCCEYTTGRQIAQVENSSIGIDEYIRQNGDADLRGNMTAKIAVLDGNKLQHNGGAEFSFKDPDQKLGALIALVTVNIPA